jgi:hypothetical protein
MANTARAQLKSLLDKLDVLVGEGRDTLVEMDLRLLDFDSDSRRLEPTELDREQ